MSRAASCRANPHRAVVDRERLLRLFPALLVAGVVVLMAMTALFSPGKAAAAKSFALRSLHTTAAVNADASMDVTEVVTYSYDGGPFNFGIRSFQRDLDKISGFTASDPRGPLEVIAPAQSVSHMWEWHLRQPTSNDTVTYTLKYHVAQAVTVGSDVADLNWQFIGDDHPGVGEMKVEISFPAGIPAAQPDTLGDD
ncbi:MAG: DUF2207 domain-containing protein, partial [Ilumatobacteraceae bacterium]